MSAVRTRIAPGGDASRRARASLAGLRRELGEEVFHDLCLLVSELVTNSVRHSGTAGPVGLEVEVDDERVRVVVSDGGPGFAARPRPCGRRGARGGWGLYLVEVMSDRWGVESDPETRAWFELARDGAAA